MQKARTFAAVSEYKFHFCFDGVSVLSTYAAYKHCFICTRSFLGWLTLVFVFVFVCLFVLFFTFIYYSHRETRNHKAEQEKIILPDHTAPSGEP